MTEQQIAPASANLEYRARPLSFAGDWALAFCMAASTLGRPVVEGGGEAAMIEMMEFSEEWSQWYSSNAMAELECENPKAVQFWKKIGRN